LPEEVKVSKAERRAKHAELNKQLWDSAYDPWTRHFNTTGEAPANTICNK
jgi:hypothetical protein